VIAVGGRWPGNRNDVVVARRILAHHQSPPNNRRADHPRRPLPQTPPHPSRVEHVSARLND
jgi:hypothetical protein